MKKLLAFLLCFVLLCSFLASCSSDDSPVSDDGGHTDKYGTWTFKRFVPAKEGDPDTFFPEKVNALWDGGIRAPYYAPYEFNRLRASSRDEMVKLLSGLPYGAVYGFYATALYRLHQEGFYIEPQYDGKSVFAWNERLYLYPRTSIEIEGASQSSKWGEWGYECQIDMGDEKNLYVSIRYLPKRYVAYAREYPFMYGSGFPDPGKASDEQLIQQCADSCIELMVDGKMTKAYLRADSDYLQRLYFVCDAGYMVTLKSKYGAQLDLVAIAEKMSFTKVPLENIAVMQGPAAPYWESYYDKLPAATSHAEMLAIANMTDFDALGAYEYPIDDLNDEGFYIMPEYDGQSVFARNETLYFNPLIGYYYPHDLWGYHTNIELEQGDVYVSVVYVSDRTSIVKEGWHLYYDLLARIGIPEEEFEKTSVELTVEGKKTKAYLKTNSEYSQTLYFDCEAGYAVALESRNGDNLDLFAIAEKMSFTKVPLTETEAE